ncbi:Plasmodium vivax Vir protein, putative [Plasmodium ovale]|uniref:Plasmodium vivax Vir protein, putative n=1 Tax=Plasmodium ovale TaxID=36330 RepID=A0A1C3KI53_PLAOA|nr:Plasmodium vivax Vir protein, putative [Plasmodium ovale]
MSSPGSDIYSFFEAIKTYSFYEVQMEQYFKGDGAKETCNSFPHYVQISSTESANNICEKFLYLYNLIINHKTHKGKQYLSINDFAYLNFWINSKLRNNTNSYKITVNEFHEKMGDHELEFVTGIFKGKIYDLEENHFKNMNLLYYLYDNYGLIFNKIKSNEKEEKISCLQYAQELIDNYKKGIIQCHIDKSNFCKALKHFKGVYEKITRPDGVSEKCVDRESLQLPTYNDALLEYKNINVVGSILGPSFATLFTSVFLYMFTPLGQRIRAIMGRNNGIHSDLYEENNESFLSSSDNDHINVDENSYHISYDTDVNF